MERIVENLQAWFNERLAKIAADLAVPSRSERLAEGRKQLADVTVWSSRPGMGYVGPKRSADVSGGADGR